MVHCGITVRDRVALQSTFGLIPAVMQEERRCCTLCYIGKLQIDFYPKQWRNTKSGRCKSCNSAGLARVFSSATSVWSGTAAQGEGMGLLSLGVAGMAVVGGMLSGATAFLPLTCLCFGACICGSASVSVVSVFACLISVVGMSAFGDGTGACYFLLYAVSFTLWTHCSSSVYDWPIRNWPIKQRHRRNRTRASAK